MKFGSAPIVGALSSSVAGGTPLISGIEARRQPNTEKGLRPLDYLQTSHEAVQALGVSTKTAAHFWAVRNGNDHLESSDGQNPAAISSLDRVWLGEYRDRRRS